MVNLRSQLQRKCAKASMRCVATAELPAMVIAILAVECVGRKLPMAALMAAAGAATLGLTAFPSTALIACARCGISAAFTVLYVYTPEVCPAPETPCAQIMTRSRCHC